jgi:imidazole glycerol-phosphate synthase subunit HisH
MGNLRSVQKAIEQLGSPSQLTTDLSGAEKVVLPGVGAFGAAMERLEPIADEIRAFVASGGPLLGICLGQQLLFERSEELGQHKGLGLIPGQVLYLPKDRGLKVPHMGWSPLYPQSAGGLMKGISEGEQVYFVHSLYTACEDPGDIAALAEYALPFPAAVQRANVWGTQFHPEKSSDVGLRILKNFLEC